LADPVDEDDGDTVGEDEKGRNDTVGEDGWWAW
jgi:hypothetical protein